MPNCLYTNIYIQTKKINNKIFIYRTEEYFFSFGNQKTKISEKFLFATKTKKMEKIKHTYSEV